MLYSTYYGVHITTNLFFLKIETCDAWSKSTAERKRRYTSILEDTKLMWIILGMDPLHVLKKANKPNEKTRSMDAPNQTHANSRILSPNKVNENRWDRRLGNEI